MAAAVREFLGAERVERKDGLGARLPFPRSTVLPQETLNLLAIRCIYTDMKTDPGFSECLDCSCFAARRAARTITQHYERHLKPSGLRVSQFTLLTMLTLGGPQPLSRLADRMAVERTTLTRTLAPLLARGLVSESATGDRRVRLLAITKRGTAAAVAALPRWREAQRSIADRLGGDVIRALAATSVAAAELSPGRS